MKHKNGRRTSHSYWSWIHGPRETTHASSGRRPWWWRRSRWWSSPPAGCREEFPWRSRSWKRGGGETEMRSWKRVPVPRVSRRALNIRQRVASEGLRGAQAPPRRGLGGGGRATRAPRPLVAPLRLSFGVPEGSGTLIFYIFFPEFF